MALHGQEEEDLEPGASPAPLEKVGMAVKEHYAAQHTHLGSTDLDSTQVRKWPERGQGPIQVCQTTNTEEADPSGYVNTNSPHIAPALLPTVLHLN